MSYHLVWKKRGKCIAGTQEMELIDPINLDLKNKTTQKCFMEKTECKYFFVF